MAASNEGSSRPLSPHLTIFRWHIPMLTSILTRVTGNALIVSFFLGVAWLISAVTSDWAFGWVNWFVTSWLGDLIWVFSALGMWFHYLTGLRHLIYDAGKGLDLPTAEKLGMICLVGSVVLTVLTVIIVMI